MASISTVLENARSGLYDALFSEIYGGASSTIAKKRERCEALLASFAEAYGAARDVCVCSSPGRVELCGNHTDHNDGIVLAAAINLDTLAVASRSNDGLVRIRSEGFGGEHVVDISNPAPDPSAFGTTDALISGVAASIREMGGETGGFDACIVSDVLKGSGLSSSAAFEVCVGTILNSLYNSGRISPIDIAIAGQRAENIFFGKPSGLMDQLACSVGGVVAIDFAKRGEPVASSVPFDLASFGYSLVVTDTKGDHSGLTDEYAAIRTEMESVARVFGEESLGRVDRGVFLSRIPEARADAGDRAVLRAIHFFEDCRRVRELTGAIRRSDMKNFLSLIAESGHSSFEYNQNAYSASHPTEQGVPLGLAVSQLALGERGAWRLQGGGFAGTIQAFVPNDLLDEYNGSMSAVFGDDACRVLTFRNRGAETII